MDKVKCLIRLKTHATIVRVDEDDHIHCFKYNHNQTRCELESFYSEEMAVEFILEPMPDFVCRLTINGQELE